RSQATIAANERKFRLLIQNISEIVALIDTTGIVRFVSPQTERVLGTPPSEFMGHDVFDFVHPEERARAHEEFAKTVCEPGEAVPSMLRFREASGKWVPFEVIANNQVHEPDVSGIIFTARDLRYRRGVGEKGPRAQSQPEVRVEPRPLGT